MKTAICQIDSHKIYHHDECIAYIKMLTACSFKILVLERCDSSYVDHLSTTPIQAQTSDQQPKKTILLIWNKLSNHLKQYKIVSNLQILQGIRNK